MEMSTSRVDIAAPVNSSTASPDWDLNDRQVITAVQRLNGTEWLGQERELTYRRDPKTGRLTIQIRDRESGEVLDQIPPESILRLEVQIQEELESKD